MHNMCGKCSKYSAVTILLVGVGFLARDWGWWTFGNLNWYTVAFLLVGLGGLGSVLCKDCASCGCCGPAEAPAPKKKR